MRDQIRRRRSLRGQALRLLREAGKESKSDTVADLLTDDGGARVVAWWDGAVPTAGTLAERCVRRAAWRTRRSSRRVLRFRPDRPFGEGRHLCLLALYRDIRPDTPQAITRTALTPDARKIDR
jgi:hypothetical protein